MFIGYVDKDGMAYKNNLEPAGIQVLDNNGKLLLKPDESILGTLECDCEINTKWKNFGSQPLFYPGKGMLYKTSKALVFIRIIGNPFDRLRGGFSLISSLPEALWIKKCKELGLKEYFEIPLNEINGLKQPFLGPLSVCLTVQDKKFHICIASLIKAKELFKEYSFI